MAGIRRRGRVGVCEDACVEILGLAIAPAALALAVALPRYWERRGGAGLGVF